MGMMPRTVVPLVEGLHDVSLIDDTMQRTKSDLTPT